MLDMTVDRDDMDGEGQFEPLRKFMLDHYSSPDESSDNRLTSSDSQTIVSKSELVAVFKMMVDAKWPHDQIKDILSVLVKKSSDASDKSSDNRLTTVSESAPDPVARKRARDVEYQRKHRLKVKKASELSDDAQNRDISIVSKVETLEGRQKERKRDSGIRARASYPDDFEKFWREYPRTPAMGKAETFAAWKKTSPEERALAIAAVPKFKDWLKTQKPDYPVVHAVRFLTKKRFDGFHEAATVDLKSEEYQRALEEARRVAKGT